MWYCPHYSLPLHTTDKGEGDALIYRARCKQWTCEYCAELNRRVWRARLMLEVEKEPVVGWYFWTFTLLGKDHEGDTATSLQVWREHWDTLMKRLKRDVGKFRYVRVFEGHKSGILHVHMLADATYSDVVEIAESDGRVNYRSDTCEKHLIEIGLGWRHDIKPIITTDYSEDGHARNVSAYVTKYLTKAIQSNVRQLLKDAGMPRVRMIQTSQRWSRTPKYADIRTWSQGGISFDDYDTQIEQGIQTIDVDNQRVVKPMDFHGERMYPNRISDLTDIADSY